MTDLSNPSLFFVLFFFPYETIIVLNQIQDNLRAGEKETPPNILQKQCLD